MQKCITTSQFLAIPKEGADGNCAASQVAEAKMDFRGRIVNVHANGSNLSNVAVRKFRDEKSLMCVCCHQGETAWLSAIANWQAKNEDASIEEAGLFVKEICVDSAGMLKRLRPAPQGRAHRIRKRSNHVTIVLGNKNNAIQS